MNPVLLLIIILLYFSLLILISYFTSKDGDSDTFFRANRNSPWYVVAFGMVGASLSGVTFISVPGWVNNSSFSYMQMVLGYLVGYAIIAGVLLPLYYRMNLTSIYTYLGERFGIRSYKTGSSFFLLSRLIGASFRLYLVALVLYEFVLGPMGVSFALTVGITLILIYIYTFKGGINTIVWTDTLQTTFMLTAVIFTLWFLYQQLPGDEGLVERIVEDTRSQIFFFRDGWEDPNNFFKMFVSGALIALVMTGLDQDMMQKNLTCRTLGDAQKNVISLSIVLVFVNLLFLGLGLLLYQYAAFEAVELTLRNDGEIEGDLLFPVVALQHMPAVVGVIFVIGLISAAYSSADSALTSLTTAFCIDILGFERKVFSEDRKKKMRYLIHIIFAGVIFSIILIFSMIKNEEVIASIFKVAAYTYGPLLGLYSFGYITAWKVRDPLVPLVCITAPVLTYFININSEEWFNGYSFGFELLLINGLLTFLGLILLINGRKEKDRTEQLLPASGEDAP